MDNYVKARQEHKHTKHTKTQTKVHNRNKYSVEWSFSALLKACFFHTFYEDIMKLCILIFMCWQVWVKN